jgi:D-alanyl-D-alanine carboxypeptidase (penicillin-binding protein 5/6)
MKLRLIIVPAIFASSLLVTSSFVPNKANKYNASKVITANINTAANLLSEPSSNKIVVSPIADINPEEDLTRAGLLFDVKQKKVIWEKDMKTSFPIASLTKMMVALLTVEDIKSGKLNWDTKVKVTKEASHMGGSRVFLKKGEVFTIRDLMKSAMIASGNDACYLLAQYNGGTEQEFVKRMNLRAWAIGMKTTRYSNSTGLPTANNKDNKASAYDLLLLASELLKHNEILDISSREEEHIKHGNHQFAYRNHNKLVIEYKDVVDGLKTGFTNKAGFCIVATSNKSNRRLISVVLGVKKSATRNSIVADMMNNYYGTIGISKMEETKANN